MKKLCLGNIWKGRRGELLLLEDKYYIGISEIPDYIHCLANTGRMRCEKEQMWKLNETVLITF